jgi:hypothetical protein
MGWNAPRTWAVGEMATAVLLNQQIRDDFLEQAMGKALAAGDLFHATGVNALARLAIGSTDQVYQAGASAAAWGAAPAAGNALLAATIYDPGTATTLSITSTSFADVDATNLAITFTAPASGKVLVVLSAMTKVGAGASPLEWNLRESTSNIADSDNRVNADAGRPQRVTLAIYLTGISSGSKTWKWGFRIAAGSTAADIRVGGSNQGPAVMEVWEV